MAPVLSMSVSSCTLLPFGMYTACDCITKPLTVTKPLTDTTTGFCSTIDPMVV
jgi:hypothetical protein